MQNILVGKRVLVTQSTEFMGPVLCEVFAEQGATVVANPEPLSEPNAAERVVLAAGTIDVMVANLAFTAPTTPPRSVRNANGARSSPRSWTRSQRSSEPQCRRWWPVAPAKCSSSAVRRRCVA